MLVRVAECAATSIRIQAPGVFGALPTDVSLLATDETRGERERPGGHVSAGTGLMQQRTALKDNKTRIKNMSFMKNAN